MTGRRRVAITGLGLVTPAGNDAAETWRTLLKGRSCISAISRFDASGFPVRIAAEVKQFDEAAVPVDRKLLKFANRSHRFALAAAEDFEPVSQQVMTIFSLNRLSASPAVATCSGGTCRASMTWPASNSALLRTSTSTAPWFMSWMASVGPMLRPPERALLNSYAASAHAITTVPPKRNGCRAAYSKSRSMLRQGREKRVADYSSPVDRLDLRGLAAPAAARFQGARPV